MSTVHISNNSKTKLPQIPFTEIVDTTLGSTYDLSLTFVSSDYIKKLNNQYRNKNYPTDILSFSLSQNEGEIYICISETKKKAKEFARSYENFLAFLFIHGCVHLKGHDHGGTMENIEIEIRKKFGV